MPMQPNFLLSPAQIQTLAGWTFAGADAAIVSVEPQNDGSIYVVQQDEHACIDRTGETVELEIRHA